MDSVQKQKNKNNCWLQLWQLCVHILDFLKTSARSEESMNKAEKAERDHIHRVYICHEPTKVISSSKEDGIFSFLPASLVIPNPTL